MIRLAFILCIIAYICEYPLLFPKIIAKQHNKTNKTLTPFRIFILFIFCVFFPRFSLPHKAKNHVTLPICFYLTICRYIMIVFC